MVKTTEMRFKCKENCCEKAQDILDDVEAQTGLKLHIDKVGDEVHGDISTVFYHDRGEGEVLIRLYEEEETPTLTQEQYDQAPSKVKAKSKIAKDIREPKVHTGHFKPHGLAAGVVNAIHLKNILKTAKKAGEL